MFQPEKKILGHDLVLSLSHFFFFLKYENEFQVIIRIYHFVTGDQEPSLHSIEILSIKNFDRKGGILLLWNHLQPDQRYRELLLTHGKHTREP
jgi:hypothetical protein